MIWNARLAITTARNVMGGTGIATGAALRRTSIRLAARISANAGVA